MLSLTTWALKVKGIRPQRNSGQTANCGTYLSYQSALWLPGLLCTRELVAEFRLLWQSHPHLLPQTSPAPEPCFLPPASHSYITQRVRQCAFLVLLPLPVTSLVLSLLSFFLPLPHPRQGPVHSTGHAESGLSQMPLAALSLTPTIKILSTILWSSQVRRREWLSLDCLRTSHKLRIIEMPILNKNGHKYTPSSNTCT